MGRIPKYKQCRLRKLFGVSIPVFRHTQATAMRNVQFGCAANALDTERGLSQRSAIARTDIRATIGNAAQEPQAACMAANARARGRRTIATSTTNSATT